MVIVRLLISYARHQLAYALRLTSPPIVERAEKEGLSPCHTTTLRNHNRLPDLGASLCRLESRIFRTTRMFSSRGSRALPPTLRRGRRRARGRSPGCPQRRGPRPSGERFRYVGDVFRRPSWTVPRDFLSPAGVIAGVECDTCGIQGAFRAVQGQSKGCMSNKPSSSAQSAACSRAFWASSSSTTGCILWTVHIEGCSTINQSPTLFAVALFMEVT